LTILAAERYVRFGSKAHVSRKGHYGISIGDVPLQISTESIKRIFRGATLNFVLELVKP
jgi:hypothetical protein